MYALTPAEALTRIHAEFPDYQVCQFHDTAGIGEVLAVLNPAVHHTGLPRMVCAASTGELAAILHTHHTQRRTRLPRRDPTRRYWNPSR